MGSKWNPEAGKEPPKAREVKKTTKRKLKVTGNKKSSTTSGKWGLK